MREEWRDAVGFEGYQVSNLGNVRNVRLGTLLKGTEEPQGYRRVRAGSPVAPRSPSATSRAGHSGRCPGYSPGSPRTPPRRATPLACPPPVCSGRPSRPVHVIHRTHAANPRGRRGGVSSGGPFQSGEPDVKKYAVRLEPTMVENLRRDPARLRRGRAHRNQKSPRRNMPRAPN